MAHAGAHMTGTSGVRAGEGVLAPNFETSARATQRGATPVSAALQRKLLVGHFAFMRSVVPGQDPRES